MKYLLRLGPQPIAHHYLEDFNQQEIKHELDLEYCEDCGFIQIKTPISPETLYKNYICLSSWKPQPHRSDLLNLIRRMPGLYSHSRIIEIGCNDGVFLNDLKNAGYTKTLGVEPADDAYEQSTRNGLEVIYDFFFRPVASKIVKQHGKFDLLIARQVLEHIQDLKEFSESMKTVLNVGARVLIEIPDFEFFLRWLDYGGIWEEHTNYFTSDTLSRYLRKAHIQVEHTETLNFSGQALVMLGVYSPEDRNPPTMEKGNSQLSALLSYKKHYISMKNAFASYLKPYRKEGRRVIIYGGGCRSTALINFLSLGGYLDFAVDDQKEKQNKYMAGSRLLIHDPSELYKHPGSLCLLAVNAENESLVLQKHERYIDIGGKFLSVNPPSGSLPDFWKEMIEGLHARKV